MCNFVTIGEKKAAKTMRGTQRRKSEPLERFHRKCNEYRYTQMLQAVQCQSFLTLPLSVKFWLNQSSFFLLLLAKIDLVPLRVVDLQQKPRDVGYCPEIPHHTSRMTSEFTLLSMVCVRYVLVDVVSLFELWTFTTSLRLSVTSYSWIRSWR